jgi:2'-5' RNA ligase
VPEAEHAVAEYRLAHDWSAPLAVPAHITILFPFVAPEAVDEAALGVVFGRIAAFAFQLDRVERFDEGGVWLHPEPSEPFRTLTRAVWKRWPDHPPYEGAHDEVTPHLTVSYEPLDVTVALPIDARADAVTLLEEGKNGRWRERARFPLGRRVAAHAVEQRGVEAVGESGCVRTRAEPGVGPVGRREK